MHGNTFDFARENKTEWTEGDDASRQKMRGSSNDPSHLPFYLNPAGTNVYLTSR